MTTANSGPTMAVRRGPVLPCLVPWSKPVARRPYNCTDSWMNSVRRYLSPSTTSKLQTAEDRFAQGGDYSAQRKSEAPSISTSQGGHVSATLNRDVKLVRYAQREAATVISLLKGSDERQGTTHSSPKQGFAGLVDKYLLRGQGSRQAPSNLRDWPPDSSPLRRCSVKHLKSGPSGGRLRVCQQTRHKRCSSAPFSTSAPSAHISPTFVDLSGTSKGLPGKEGQSGKPDLSNSHRTWSAEEERVLLDMRATGCTWREIASRFGRSLRSVRIHHCEALPLEPPQTHKPFYFSATEHQQMLEKRAQGHTWREIALTIPGRSIESLRKHYNYTDQSSSERGSHQRWTTEQINEVFRLRNNELLPWPAIAQKFPNRSVVAVKAVYRATCKRLGMPVVRVNPYWTKEESTKLLQYRAEGKSIREIASLMDGRSYTGVREHWRNFYREQAEPPR